MVFNASGAMTGQGNYTVTGLVSFIPAPGGLPSGAGIEDRIGRTEDARAGLSTLRIQYDDGDSGILTVSCRLPGSPDEIFEGITVTKGFVAYFDSVAPLPGADANRTVFHVVP